MAVNQNIRFMANNFLTDLATASITALSTKSGYAVSNIQNSLRSKVWRSKGAFEITTTNQNLAINDGSDQTVAITTGTYTYTTLATQIETDLNAASDLTWTCTYDFSGGTFKFTITSSASATLRFSENSSAIWDSIGFTGTSDSTGTSWIADEQRNHTREYLKFDLRTAQAFTFFAVITDPDEIFPISSSATINLYANTIDSFTSPPLSVALTRTRDGIFSFFDSLSDTTYRYIMFEFEDRLNTVGPEGFHIGHVYLGDHTTMTSRNISPGFIKTFVDPSRSYESESGARFFDERTKYQAFDNLTIGYIEAADRVNLEDLYRKVGTTRPFYVSFDPTLAFTETLNEMTAYVNFTDNPKFTHFLRDVYSMSVNLREAL